MTKAQREDEATYARLSAMHPFAGGGFGHTIDIARAVLFLCSPDNSFMTGVMLPVDGGYGAM
jgi:NAD(P)-dependent dehydrogenase (short-subunit alcohol dehydrogenase family)